MKERKRLNAKDGRGANVIHRRLVDDITVEYRRGDGSSAGAQAKVIDFDDPESSDWLAVNQLTVAEGQHTRRPDVVLFVNGLPLVVIELENPADELKEALATYIESGGAGKTALDQAEAVAVMLEKVEVLSEAWATT